MTLRHGDIVLVPFPFTDLRSTKQRPALVVSSTAYNTGGRDVILAAMTSNLANTAHSVLVKGKDLTEGRLAADSRVKVDKLATLEQALVRRTVGRLRPGVLAQVYKELLALLPADAHR